MEKNLKLKSKFERSEEEYKEQIFQNSLNNYYMPQNQYYSSPSFVDYNNNNAFPYNSLKLSAPSFQNYQSPVH